jgi:hypothetical protein
MKSYDQPITMSYNFGSHDFGAGAGAHAIRKPLGAKSARIEEIHLGPISEAFTATTTPGYVRIGTAGDADKFAQLDCGVAAISDGYGIDNDPDAVFEAGKYIDLARAGDAGVALNQLEVTFVAPTGGTPAGIGFVTVVVSWF